MILGGYCTCMYWQGYRSTERMESCRLGLGHITDQGSLAFDTGVVWYRLESKLHVTYSKRNRTHASSLLCPSMVLFLDGRSFVLAMHFISDLTPQIWCFNPTPSRQAMEGAKITSPHSEIFQQKITSSFRQSTSAAIEIFLAGADRRRTQLGSHQLRSAIRSQFVTSVQLQSLHPNNGGRLATSMYLRNISLMCPASSYLVRRSSIVNPCTDMMYFGLGAPSRPCKGL
jgi:hypothetical protein